jgi:hypothetical protein
MTFHPYVVLNPKSMTNALITNNRLNTDNDSFEKGRLFEEYIKNLFNKSFFHIDKWRMSKQNDNTLEFVDYCNPDFEIILFGKRKYRFAVECKWRKQFIAAKIEWADISKIEKYLKFENQNRIPVFVAIGVGGEPSMPDKLFVTPLQNLRDSPQVYESDLIPYKRDATRKFYYDAEQLKLF